MELVLFILIGIFCFYQASVAYMAEDQTHIFCKRKLALVDVKAYNKYCAKLIAGFGIVVEITMIFMIASSGWICSVLFVVVLAEAYGLLKIYSKNEIKFLRK